MSRATQPCEQTYLEGRRCTYSRAVILFGMQGNTTTLFDIRPMSVNGRLSIFDKLTTLRIHIDIGTYSLSFNTPGSPQVQLSQLKSLICDVHTYEAFETLETIATWKLPKLRKLSLHLSWISLREGKDFKPVSH